MAENCVFCKILAGELPSYTVYEDDMFKAILDINPSAEGHVILIAKTHAENILETPDEYLRGALTAAKKTAAAVKRAVPCDGFNILQNNGEAAGQSQPHFHIHIIPRRINDDINMKWNFLKFTKEQFTQTADKIKKYID